MTWTLSDHARRRLEGRNIPLEWVQRVIEFPEREVADPRHFETVVRWRRIEEHGQRVLRVAVNPVTRIIITAYFDRRMTRIMNP